MKRKLLCFALLLLIVVNSFGCGNEKTITGNEWLIIQEQCLEDLKSYADGMDEVYTLYFIEAISKEDFANELVLLNQQYKILKAFYEKLKTENPLEPGSHSFVSKKGTEAIENLYTCFGEILKNSVDENGQPLPQSRLAYRYLAYRQNIIGYISEFTMAITIIKYENGEYNDISFTTTEPSTSESSTSEDSVPS